MIPPGLYASAGKLRKGAEVGARKAARTAMAGVEPGARKAAAKNAKRDYYISKGKAPVRAGLFFGGLAAGSAMLMPSANHTRGGYMGPTAKGSGRYA